MQTILQQITAIDGVIGSTIYNNQGKVLAAACPLILDEKQLGTAAGTILDCLHALQISQTLSSMELRFAEGRLIVRPLADAYISVLCSKNVNTSMVNITLNLALRKLEQMLPKPGEAPVAAATTVGGAEGMMLRIAHLQKGDVSSSFDQLGMVAVSQATAKQISNFFGKSSKKFKVTTDAGGGGTFPVMIINDVEMQYDNALVVGPGIERKLKVEEGAKVTIELA
jgi:predicted regulator of Ras-like GTPase activity (Roadblock/LC7/MglB family)